MELVFLLRMTATTFARHRGTWTFESKVPADWPELLQRHGGGFFHTPLGLLASATEGEPVYARYYLDHRVVGIAAGVKLSCRLSGFITHLYLPTWPAFADPAVRQVAMSQLAGALREGSVAEVRWDGFDPVPGECGGGKPTRQEYTIDLRDRGTRDARPVPPAIVDVLREGDREGWTLHALRGQEAGSVWVGMSVSGILRNGCRGVVARSSVPQIVTAATPPSSFWDLTTYVVMGKGEAIAATLTGQTGCRAYCLAEAATPAGRLHGANAWLQAQLVDRLTAEGLTRYNLGPAPYHAPDPSDPGNAAHRLRTALGATPIPCGGEQWVLLAAHLRSHQLFSATARSVS